MKKNNNLQNFLKDEGNALCVQNHQIENVQNKLSEVNSRLDDIQEYQKENSKFLDSMNADIDSTLDNMEHLLNNINTNELQCTNNSEIQELISTEIKLDSIQTTIPNRKRFETIEMLDTIEYDDSMSWEEYMKSVESYGIKYNLNLNEDPFKKLMSASQRIELEKRIKEDFSYKNAKCDKYDYMIAGTCGVIGGLVDALFVGGLKEIKTEVIKNGKVEETTKIIYDSKLGNFTDEMANKATEKFAEWNGWDKEKAISRGSDTTKSAIGFLEKKFRINYDQATTNGKNGTGGLVSNLSAKNHHLKSLGHSPDIIGLFFSILNQFTNTSSFINNGKIITIETETFELQGGNVIAKIFCGFCNWFGHLASDWTGSSGAQGRGSGIPIPFYNLFQLCDFGNFGQHRQTFAQITTKVFERGYDLRHGMAMAIPVAITEILIRFMYVVKARFYHKKDWKDCIPNADIPELRRMLTIGHGSLCLIDGADAVVRSGGGTNPVLLLGRMNLIAWVRFGNLAIKEVRAWWLEGKMDIEKIDEHLDKSTIEMSMKFRV